MSRTWEVTWITTDGAIIKIVEADDLQFAQTGGVVFGKKSNVVPISTTPGQQAADPIIVAHVQGYTSLVVLDE